MLWLPRSFLSVPQQAAAAGKRHCAGFTDINIPGFCQFCKGTGHPIVKKVFFLPFSAKVCYNGSGIPMP
jgi:hypothetical protein